MLTMLNLYDRWISYLKRYRY